MRIVSSLLGAVGIATAAGFAVGASMPTQPLDSGYDPLAAIPDHEIQTIPQDVAAKRMPIRDQFPLETENGVIPVRELAMYGRKANRMREQPLYGASTEEEAYGLSARYQPVQAAPAQPQALNAVAVENIPIRADQPVNFVPLEPGIFAEDAPHTHASVQVEVNSGYSEAG